MKTIQPPTVSRVGGALAGLILLTLLNSTWPAAVAAPVTSKDAAAAVMGWLNVNRTPLGETLGGTVQRVESFNDQSGDPLYYVVYLDPSGFVIVSADDLVEPIVGFASAGKFDPSGNNPLGALISKDLPARITQVRQAGSAFSETSALQAKAKWHQLLSTNGGPGQSPNALASVSDVRVAPLTQSTWSQQTAGSPGTPACYNYYTPPYGDGNMNNYPAGCVATAMAQLMRYYQYPSTGVGTNSLSISIDGHPSTYSLHGGDGSGGAYVWSNMPLNPPSSPSTAQCQAIGALVADAGATVHMQYASGGSSSYPTDIRGALLGTFLFGNAILGYNNTADISASLINMINPNLDARYPVLLSIQGPTGGHAVVADGYGYDTSTLYHHLNLGWSGTASIWYALPLIDTGIYLYNVVDGCVYNAYTNGTGEIISGRVLDQISRPVTNATVTATRSGGGVYTTTTDSKGIYALARIPSGSSYSIAINRANYSPVSTNVSTGTSVDRSLSNGNRWVSDLTMNMLTTAIDHLVWNTVTATQALSTPFAVTLTAQNLINGPASGFTGPVALSAYASGLAAGGTLVGSLGPPLAGRSSASGLTHGYAFTPNTTILVTHVRNYTGDSVSIWTDSGTLLASQALSASGSWVEAALATPITLSAGTTYRVSAHYGANIVGWYKTPWPTTFANGAVGQNFYAAFGDTFPAQVYATGQGPLVDLRYSVVFSNSIPVSPTSSGAFANGVWSGNITVSQAATNVVLKADDGAGHVALSTPFNLVTPLRLLSPHRLAGGEFQFTVSSAPGQRLAILVSSNLVSWTTNATLTNSTGTTNYTDPATGLSKRFYRANLLM